jgi:CRP-like cAMP-binding protein
MKQSSHSCESCENRHKSLFCEVNRKVWDKLDINKSLIHLAPGKALFESGDLLEGVYCIREGAVKLERPGLGGQNHILHVVNAGGVLGLSAAMGDGSADVSAIGLQSSQICFVPKKTFNEVLQADPSIARLALKRVTLELKDMEQRLCHATDLTAVERIAEALLHLKERDAAQHWSRRELAEWAGTTTETAIRTLSQFAKEGLIEIDGRKILIKNSKGLLEKAKIYV